MKMLSMLLCLIFLTGCLGNGANTSGGVAIAFVPDETPATQVQIPARSWPKVYVPSPVPARQETALLPTPTDHMGLNQSTPTAEPTSTPMQLARSAENWKEWPVLPVVPDSMREVYQRGLELGTNPRAFSILGDCQSQPDVFLGVFESEEDYFEPLPQQFKNTVLQFNGSFNRYSPTVKDGTTEGALLWWEWNDNKDKQCNHGETPIDCELRTHRPSIVFIHVGTHWEARNRRYLTIIIDKILDSGAVPVFVTKADNREKDERVNRTMAELAVEYDLPLWNFWASVQHLPENGMEPGSDMYLSPEGLAVHRQGGLQALDAVWRAVK